MPELYNRIELVLEYEVTRERPRSYEDSSSTLVYFLFELCLLLDAQETYETYRSAFDGLNLQVWNPSADVEATLFKHEVCSGVTETTITLPESFEEFRQDVAARHQAFRSLAYGSVTQGFGFLILLACKHYGTPVFPVMWRSVIFGAKGQ